MIEKQEITFSEEFLENIKNFPEKQREQIMKFIRAEIENFDPDNLKNGGFTLEDAVIMGLIKKDK